jgi:Flp pilus assembly protein TadG
VKNQADHSEFQKGRILDSAARGKSFGQRRVSRAQAMVEFALIAPLIMIGLVVGIQFAIIGAGALALSQGAYQGARYASIHSSDNQANVKTAVDAVISPIVKSGYSLSMTPTAAPRAAGTSVQVTLTWNATSMIVLPNPFFGISFPTNYSATETAYTE